METVQKYVVFSGGGAAGVGQWETYKEWYKAGNRAEMFGGTSAGCLNALFASRGLFDLADQMYDKAYDGSASNVFGSELCDLRDGKLKLNGSAIKNTVLKGLNAWDVPKLITKKGQKKIVEQLTSNILGIQSLLNNKPLLASVKEVLAAPHDQELPFLFNVVNMVTGAVQRHSASQFPDNDMLALGVVASTTIPVALPLIPGYTTKEATYKMLGDGGLRDGSPVGQMLKQLDHTKKQEIVVFNSNRRELSTVEELSSAVQVAGRTFQILMNEILLGDLEVLLDRNKIAQEHGESPGYKYVPLTIIEASHNRSAFDFSRDSYYEQINGAKKDLESALVD